MLLKRLSLIIVLLLAAASGYAQKATVKGVITDERGNPLEKALVADEATGFGTYTDCTGTYMMEVAAGQNITFIYYAPYFKAVRRQLLMAPGATQAIDVQLEKLQAQEGTLITITEPAKAELPRTPAAGLHDGGAQGVN